MTPPFLRRSLLALRLTGLVMLCGAVGCVHRDRTAPPAGGLDGPAPPPAGLLVPATDVPPPKAPRTPPDRKLPRPPLPAGADKTGPQRDLASAVPLKLAALRAFSREPFLTRGMLARLMNTLPSPRSAPEDLPIMTDILNHPWRDEIISAVRAGVLTPYPNHQFKPEGLVTRAELADALHRAAVALGIHATRRIQSPLADVPASNPLLDRIEFTVDAGLLPADRDGFFGPSRPVTGEEGWAAVRRFHNLVGRPD